MSRVHIIDVALAGAFLLCGGLAAALATHEFQAIAAVDRALAGELLVQDSRFKGGPVGMLSARRTPIYADVEAWSWLALASRTERASPEFEQYLARSQAAAERSLAGRPSAYGPWSRLAAIDLARNGRLSAEGVYAFRQSRASAPMKFDATMWRFRFARLVWADLPPDEQDNVVADFENLRTYRVRVPPDMNIRAVLNELLADAPEGMRAATDARSP